MKTKNSHCSASLFTMALAGALMLPASAWALGPADAEVGVLYWAQDIDSDDLGSTEADGTGAYVDLWFGNAWGFSAEYLETDPDRGVFDNSSELSIDVKRRLISPTENNFLAVGAGWEELDLAGGQSSEGFRLLTEGRVGVGILFAYGELAWMPELDDAGLLRDLEGREYEVGVSITPFPFLNVRLGYREFELDFRGGSQTSDGYILGGAFHF